MPADSRYGATGSSKRRFLSSRQSVSTTVRRCWAYTALISETRRAKGTNHRSGSNLPWEYSFKAFGVPEGSMTLMELSEAIRPAYSTFIATPWLQQQARSAAKETANV